jgi:small-conductance mechanosensitive channel
MQQISDIFSYVFDPTPPHLFEYYMALGILCAAMFCLSIFLRVWFKKNREDKSLRRSLRAYVGQLQLLAVLLAFYLFFRYTGVAFLSVRALLYIILLCIAFLAYRMAKAYFKDYPAMKKNRHEQIAKNKFIPRKNHR